MIWFANHQLRIAILMYVNSTVIFPHIEKTLEEVIEDNEILTITFNRWTTKNYCQLETKSPDAFVEDFCVDLKTLRQHDCIAKQQAAHI
jgi:hypothetical protein